jgi:hypothetical protein
VLTDSAVGGTTPTAEGLFGRGIEAGAGASVLATRVLVADVTEFGVFLTGATTAALTDVLIVDVRPSARGFGAGAVAFGAARLTADRLAVTGVHGMAVAAAPLETPETGLEAGARVDGGDLFVRDVRSSTIRFDDAGDTAAPIGRRVAYGVHVGDGSAAALARVALARGGYGFFAAAGGALALRVGVITDQLDAFGASNTTSDALVLDAVARFGNAAGNALRRDADLPEAAALPAPTLPCLEVVCP